MTDMANVKRSRVMHRCYNDRATLTTNNESMTASIADGENLHGH